MNFKIFFSEKFKYITILINSFNRRGTEILLLLGQKDHKKISNAFLHKDKFMRYFERLDEKKKITCCFS